MNLEEVLLKKGLTIATAESCTGGNIVARLIEKPGSSAYVKGSIVAYSNQVKEEVLNVSSHDLIAYGAVSKPVVEQMVKGVQQLLRVDCAIATSGIAGPGGGSIDKPVGTIWIAAIYQDKIASHCLHLKGSRSENIRSTVEESLSLLFFLISQTEE